VQPLEFIVVGTPVSHQSKNAKRRAAWRGHVSTVATTAVNGVQPTADQVEVRITYFYDGTAPDVDNIVKLILDGMRNVVYIDDEQVVNVQSRKRNLDANFRVRDMTVPLAEGFLAKEDFVHIRVVEPGDLAELP